MPHAVGEGPARPRPLHRAKGLDRGARRQPHGKRGGRRRVHGEPDPLHPGSYNAQGPGPGRAGQPGSGPDRALRRAIALVSAMTETAISPIEDIIADIRAGRMVILVDEEERENEGDLVLAAQFVTPEAINFMAKHGRGLICLTLTEERCKQLNLPLMVAANRSQLGTNFTVSIEAATGVTTGISAADRARTVQVAVAPGARPEDLVQPGHIFPLMAQRGGVLVRAGHTEAGCDLAQLAGLTPAAVICEILKDDGSMARLPDLIEFARTHGLKIGTIADLIHYRASTETLVERVLERPLTTMHGQFQLVVYRDKSSGATHLALVKGAIEPDEETLVRVHEPVSIIDLLDVGGTTHSWGLHQALATIAAARSGVVVLLHRPESSQELLERSRAVGENVRLRAKYDLRNYGIGAQILRDLGVRRMRLLAIPRKMPSMTGFGLEVTGYLQPESGAQP
ncbi:3,4-dihydroxy-2-butanone-4-phosphate synthase [Pelomicrobium methylotrophicum]|uniref:3,4-dihydroxy-2-butanone 4-phosphate synthase n=2 Tax=Pelomicrobium methylotrophicum TaxID=2602750 RepID=A0A5C7EQC1_9PROT|nr:3,4-dihydroxy-2-butanone-4-phosphate synthase [Pelomicrobium methylotrophicum]